ncbi:MAG: hypothetical protein AABW49_01095 [Nanoarchaeota archaeon]
MVFVGPIQKRLIELTNVTELQSEHLLDRVRRLDDKALGDMLSEIFDVNESDTNRFVDETKTYRATYRKFERAMKDRNMGDNLDKIVTNTPAYSMWLLNYGGRIIRRST